MKTPFSVAHPTTQARQWAQAGRAWSVPLALLALCVVGLGLLIPRLGFFQDDWHAVYYAHVRGLNSLWELNRYDTRPFGAWPYQIAFRLWGFGPLGWHIGMLALRWLTVLGAWLLFRTLWPQQQRLAAWAALLFAVYPLYKLQPQAVAYTQHWTVHLLWVASLLLTALALTRPRHFWPLYLASLLLAGLHLFTNEYFSGVELLRPLLIGLLVWRAAGTNRRRLGRTFLLWLPYLLIVVAFVVWRALLLRTPLPDWNQPTVFLDLFRDPLGTGLTLALAALQDTWMVLLGSWAQVASPTLWNGLLNSANGPILLVSMLAAAALYAYLTWLGRGDLEAQDGRALREAALLGLVAAFLGPLPAWMTGQQISQENPLWSDRLGLAAMLGAALFTAALLEALIADRRKRTLVVSLMLALAVGWHLRSANNFRWSWALQERFYQQLYWRAPSIQPGTPLLSDGEFLPLMGYYPTSYALNTLYRQGDPQGAAGYWLWGLDKHFETELEDLREGKTLAAQKFSTTFSGSSLDSLVIVFQPDQNQCLWVVRPRDAQIKLLPESVQQVASISNLSRIGREPVGAEPDPSIFRIQPDGSWCYYFEQADLARQYGDWAQVQKLWQQARQAGLEPGNGVEYIPFIEAAAYTGDWPEAFSLTRRANKVSERLEPGLCAVWQGLAEEAPSAAEGAATIAKAREYLRCTVE